VSECICTLPFDRARRIQPGLGHGAFNEVPLNPSACRAGKRSQILAGAARFNRREFHWRTASRAWWTLVLFVEHGVLVRRPEFSGKPTGRRRCQGVRRDNVDLDVFAFRAFEQPVFETNRPE
jgi:hypothetical protein